MSDSSETRSNADAEIQRSKRDQQESSFLEAAVPIPDFFFNIKAEIEPIGGSKWRIRMFGYFLYFITLCVMFGSFTYYSLPAQRLSLESLVTSEWQKTGYVCKPLQKTALHGLSTDWSFEECIANVNAPDTSNVKAATKHANAVHYEYNFATDGDSNKGVISFYDIAYATSVLQKTNQATEDWKRDGYSCYPEPPYDNTFNVRFNASECFESIVPPSEESVIESTSEGYEGHFLFRPFGSEGNPYPQTFRVPSIGSIKYRLNEIYPYGGQSGAGNIDHRQLPSGGMYPDAEYRNDNGAFLVYGVLPDLNIDSNFPLLSALDAWKDVLNTAADSFGDFGTEAICNELKLNGNGFRCFDKPKPPATKELAIQRYASEYPPATICAPLKLNSPFQCTRNVEVPATTRLSLSVAAAQAVFALAGIALVVLLRKLQKPSTKTSESLSTDGDLRSMVRKLRLTVDQLRTGQDQLCTTVDHLGTGQDRLRTGQGTHEELIQKLLSKEGGR